MWLTPRAQPGQHHLAELQGRTWGQQGGRAPQQNLWDYFFTTKRDRKNKVKSCSSCVWVWSWRFWSALGAHSHWQCHVSPRDQGWLVPLCPEWGRDPRAQNSPVQSAGISRAGTLIHPSHGIQVNPEVMCCVEVGMQEWWHPLGFRSRPKGDCHGNVEVKCHEPTETVLTHHRVTG